jgi:hypothetical protein
MRCETCGGKGWVIVPECLEVSLCPECLGDGDGYPGMPYYRRKLARVLSVPQRRLQCAWYGTSKQRWATIIFERLHRLLPSAFR